MIDSTRWPATAWWVAWREKKGSHRTLRAGGFGYVDIRCDGTLSNPKGYPEAEARAAIEEAAVQKRAAIEQSIRDGVETRAWRRQSALWQAVKAWRSGKLTPGRACRVCDKELTDPPSIARSIGPCCWEHILTHENRSLELLRDQGVDRPAELARIAEARAGLIEHESAIKRRHYARLEHRYRTILEGDGSDFTKARCLQMIADEVEGTHRDRLWSLDRMEDELHGGLLRKGSLERLHGMSLAVLLGA
jgi:hypothetical protein